jgi:hypothetical protein
MALTTSTMLSLGTKAPDFQLPDGVWADGIALHQCWQASAANVYL